MKLAEWQNESVKLIECQDDVISRISINRGTIQNTCTYVTCIYENAGLTVAVSVRIRV